MDNLSLLYLSISLPFFTLYSISILIQYLNNAGANSKAINRLLLNYFLPAMQYGVFITIALAFVATQVTNKALPIMLIGPITSFLYSVAILNFSNKLYKDERRLHNLFKSEVEINQPIIDYVKVKEEVKGVTFFYAFEVVCSIALFGYSIYELIEY